MGRHRHEKTWVKVLDHIPAFRAGHGAWRLGGTLRHALNHTLGEHEYDGETLPPRFLTVGEQFGEHNHAANYHRGVKLPSWAVQMSPELARRGGYAIDPTGQNPRSWFQDQSGDWHFVGGPSFWDVNTPTRNVVEFMDYDHGDRGAISPPGGWSVMGYEPPRGADLPHDIIPPVDYDPDNLYDPVVMEPYPGETPGAVYENPIPLGNELNVPPGEDMIAGNVPPSGFENVPTEESMIPGYTGFPENIPPSEDIYAQGIPELVNSSPPEEYQNPYAMPTDFVNAPPDEGMIAENVPPDLPNPAPGESSPFSVDTYLDPGALAEGPQLLNDPGFQFGPQDDIPDAMPDNPDSLPFDVVNNLGFDPSEPQGLDFSPDGVARTFPLPGAFDGLGSFSAGNLSGTWGNAIGQAELRHFLQTGIIPTDAYGRNLGTQAGWNFLLQNGLANPGALSGPTSIGHILGRGVPPAGEQ